MAFTEWREHERYYTFAFSIMANHILCCEKGLFVVLFVMNNWGKNYVLTP